MKSSFPNHYVINLRIKKVIHRYNNNTFLNIPYISFFHLYDASFEKRYTNLFSW